MAIVSQLRLEELPEHLRERVRIGSDGSSSDGQWVLYWMRTAVRAEENPALDVALELGNRLGLPVLVYHALSERYPYASDRLHRFCLEGARDVQAALGHRGIGYGFHLERPGARGPHLRTLSDRAAAVVTEEMPVEPLRSWTARLARASHACLLSVDTACVAPMQLVGKAYERAFTYRKATRKLYDERLLLRHPDVEPTEPAVIPRDLPFDPVDLQRADLSDLIGRCEIDHAVGPVPHTVGGSKAAYARWNRFRNEGLAKYAERRNDALADGVSRMSPYLHFGMAAPMRLAREAAEAGGQGAEKFLDELLIWREMAYAFCFYRGDQDRLSSLPAWARDTLEQHRADVRPAHYSWEQLARGQTGDPLWDAAQKSLLIQGELHNNVRMTWGKAVLSWTPDARRALAMLIDLNHRYALDGRDPASYGGILWALGQFDRPFLPEQAIFGSVRRRPTQQHAGRLDVERYQAKTTRALADPIPSVAVIGAGMSGLMCARTLADHGLRVAVFEKSRGVGGRMATRRAEGDLQFDHGAQYFTARDRRFRRYVDSWQQDGLVDLWNGQIGVLNHGQVEPKSGTQRYVATPRQNMICKHLAKDLEIHLQTRIAPLEWQGDRWQLHTVEGTSLGAYDRVVVSAPAAQTAELLAASPELARQASEVEMRPCWAVMAAFAHRVDVPLDGAFVHDSPLSWVARDGSKPGRNGDAQRWVLHASDEWSDTQLEESPEFVLPQLLEAFWEATGAAPQAPTFCQAHRWRYAIPPEPLADRCLSDLGRGVVACGDWCGGPRVEGAFLSGMAAAGQILGLLKT